MTSPVKPFDTYKWRWLSVQPTEGLLKAPVFLGVLRALQRFEGQPYSSEDLRDRLVQVKTETGTPIDLARTPDRNIFRNSGQYWRGTGLLEAVRGEVQLTSLGHRVANGVITHDEFAALMIRNTVLPNPRTYSQQEIDKWRAAGLRIKPFELILAIMSQLGRTHGLKEAHLSPNELIKIVIPLAGAKESVEAIAHNVRRFRHGLNIAGWPDCAPASNDKRLAREFLLFLENFDICRTAPAQNRYAQQFILDELLHDVVEVETTDSFIEDNDKVEDEIAASRASVFPILIERKRVTTQAMARPGQWRFRRDVLGAAEGQCLLTGETIPDVLEAAHIIPVGHGGRDEVGNGFCLRIDIHRLYDAGKLRVLSDGKIHLSDQVSDAVSYSNLPNEIVFPDPVLTANVDWRNQYL